MARLLLTLFTCSVLIGCAANVQSAGEKLASDLPLLYPDQIEALEFENNPPLDPATLFIDLHPSMEGDAQLRFLCDEIRPRVVAAGGGIDVTVSYGWHSSDCPS
jgi:hypothetical protein